MIGRFPCGRDGAGDLPSLAAPSLGARKERSRGRKERKKAGAAPGGTREAVREKRLAGRRVRAMKAERTRVPAGLRGRAKEKRRAAGRCGSRLARWKEEGRSGPPSGGPVR